MRVVPEDFDRSFFVATFQLTFEDGAKDASGDKSFSDEPSESLCSELLSKTNTFLIAFPLNVSGKP